ncbi:MAG: cytochrome c oxidase subunit II [Rhodospirillales bacterium]|nr:cytochrome c oxidase subunit II [Rhodospirillales bacterium]
MAVKPRSKMLAFLFVPFALLVLVVSLSLYSGFSVWGLFRQAPENALEIKVTGYQWYWKFDYGQGIISDQLNVPVGQTVILNLTSGDVAHSFSVDQFGIEEDVLPGQITSVRFQPQKAGSSVAICGVLCGTRHSLMKTNVNVLPTDAYAEWYAKAKAEVY